MTIGGEIWTWYEGEWRNGNTPVLGAADHAAWQASMVFDGARAFEGATPDLDLHCARVVASAESLGMDPAMQTGEILELAQEGVAKFAPGTALYIRPMMWSRQGMANIVMADSASTSFAMCLETLPMAEPKGISLGLTRFRRPLPEMATTDAKAACLYPNNARMLREVTAAGYDNAIVLDALGNVAETATSNIFMVRDGMALTPAPNGTFLNGITRQRVIRLLRDAGIETHETVLTLDDFRSADEIFTTGNALKVMPVTRLEDRDLQYGPVARRARELYWDFALG